MSKLPDYLVAHIVNGNDRAGSGATSPGAEWREDEGDQQSRYRPRTYPYHRYLPYEVEDEAERQRHLDEIVRNLYIALEARDFTPGAVRWSRELRSWLGLKFDPPRKTRAKLVRLYYELALAPGLDSAVSERFASMFMTLTKYISNSLCFSLSGVLKLVALCRLFIIKKNAKKLKGGNITCVQGRT
jgi:proteasome activator subunit 4